MSIAETREELIETIQEALAVLLDPLPIAKAGGELEDAAIALQALGICNLLLYANADRCFENWVKSGHTRRYFLRKSREEGNTCDLRLAISRWDSFYDAVAAGHFLLAREIVALSVEEWQPDGEYEDDFCYRLFLHRFIAPPVQGRDAGLGAVLARWRGWLGGAMSSRIELCGALAARDPSGFAQAFDALIAERQAEIARQRRTLLAADPGFEPRAAVFVEGIALLRLAGRVGFTLRADYPLCPALARQPARLDYPADLFPELEAARAQPSGGA